MLLTLVCFGLYFFQLGSWTFIDPGETYYTEAAREMVESHEWIVPHLNYQIYFSKPILTFWLTALSYQALGSVGPFASRLPFAILASILVYAAYYTTRKISNAKAALVAGLATASAPLLVLMTKTSCIDAAFTTFLNLGLFCSALTIFARMRFTWIGIYLFLGLAVLTKGPAAIVLFLLGTVAFVILERPGFKRLFRWVLCTNPAIGLAIFFASFLPWYFAVYKATKGLFIQVFILYENLARFAGKTNIHKSNPLYYLPVLAYGIAPWFMLLPQALKATFFAPIKDIWFAGLKILPGYKTSYRPHAKNMATAKNKSGSKDGADKSGAGKGAGGFSFIDLAKQEELEAPETERLSLFYFATWALTVIGFFSLSKTKLDTYILPTIAPLAICLAVTMTRLAEPGDKDDPLKWDKGWLRVVLGMVAPLLLAAAAGFGWMTFNTDTMGLASTDYTYIIAASLLLTGTVYYIMLMRAKEWHHALVFAITAISLTLSFACPFGLRYFCHQNQDSMAMVCFGLKDATDDICFFGEYRPSVIGYLARPVDTISSVQAFVKVDNVPADGLSWGRTPRGRRQLVIADDKSAQQFASRPELKFVRILKCNDWSCYELTNGYAQGSKTLEEIFKLMLYSKTRFDSDNNYGPLTVPLGGGDADWYRVRRFSK